MLTKGKPLGGGIRGFCAMLCLVALGSGILSSCQRHFAAGSPEPKVSFGGQTFGARSVVYVLQSSGDAADTTWEYMRMCVTKSMAELGPNQECDVIWFESGGKMKCAYGKMKHPSAQDVRALDDELKRVEPRGKVKLWPALQMAMTRKPDTIVVFGWGMTLESDICKKVESLAAEMPRIYTFSGWSDDDTMKALAEVTGGEHRRLTGCELDGPLSVVPLARTVRHFRTAPAAPAP